MTSDQQLGYLSHPVLGELNYESGWWGTLCFPFLGRDRSIKLLVDCYDDEEIDELQRQCFQYIQARALPISVKLGAAIFDEYQQSRDEIGQQFGLASAIAVAGGPSELDDFVQLEFLTIPKEGYVEIAEAPGAGYFFGFGLRCEWNRGADLGVRFFNEEAVEVGPQGIVL